jgi:pimeloyl-ACP methyl ester carboxylesterase
VSQEDWLAASAELLMDRALRSSTSLSGKAANQDAADSTWLEVARYSYAYLFFSERLHASRSLEDRQMQVRDYYNYAVERIVASTFLQMEKESIQTDSRPVLPMPPGWTITLDLSRLGSDTHDVPQAMLPASGLGFKGIRNQYRREGFGSEMVAVLPSHPVDLEGGDNLSVRPGQLVAMHTPNLTLVLRFEGQTLDEVMSTKVAALQAFDPLLDADIEVGGQRAPLAANYTAGYGVWLAHARFGGHSIRTLLGMRSGLERPKLYMLQPYDPERRVLLLIHGLASSPEAWVNLANDILGDETLRNRYQIWLIYYPTSLPLPYNHMAVRATVLRAFNHLDPERNDLASRKMVLVGHSMGGLIARLMVSSSEGGELWTRLELDDLPDGLNAQALRAELDPLLRFEPMPEVESVTFIAAPHRGSARADGMLAALVRSLSKLPKALLDRYRHTSAIATDVPDRLPLSIDNLSERDPFIIASAQLPIRSDLDYHSIIARKKPSDELTFSSDGVVSYKSAHLALAASETIVTHGHSAQESPQAILALRRILRDLVLSEAGGTAPQ